MPYATKKKRSAGKAGLPSERQQRRDKNRKKEAAVEASLLISDLFRPATGHNTRQSNPSPAQRFAEGEQAVRKRVEKRLNDEERRRKEQRRRGPQPTSQAASRRNAAAIKLAQKEKLLALLRVELVRITSRPEKLRGLRKLFQVKAMAEALRLELEGMTRTSAATTVHSFGRTDVGGVRPSTIETWLRDLEANDGRFAPYARGASTPSTCYLFDAGVYDVVRMHVLEWIGKWRRHQAPGVTVEAFQKAVNEKLIAHLFDPDKAEEHVRKEFGNAYYNESTLQTMIHQARVLAEEKEPIARSTAANWLRMLGFTFEKSLQKSVVYIDGHERPDVKEYRADYCKRMMALQRRTNQYMELPLPADGEGGAVNPSDDDEVRVLFKKRPVLYCTTTRSTLCLCTMMRYPLTRTTMSEAAGSRAWTRKRGGSCPRAGARQSWSRASSRRTTGSSHATANTASPRWTATGRPSGSSSRWSVQQATSPAFSPTRRRPCLCSTTRRCTARLRPMR